jgi:ubiquinone/menaquinone biosynthesis C-methylase UbiE
MVEGAEAVCAGEGHRFAVVEDIPLMVDDRVLAADAQYGRQREYFDAEFAGYSRYQLENWRLSYLQRLRAAGLLGSGEGPVLDVGVGGSGYTVIEAARTGSTAVGCDLSLEGLRSAGSFAAAEGVAGRTLWVCCSAEKLPFAPASFASALAIAVLEHVPDDRAALNELARVLRPGGRAWVTVPHALRNISPVFRLPNRRHDRRLGHLRRYEAETLVEEGRRVGLVAEEVHFTGHPVKVLQLVGRSLGDRFWWWCERRDLGRSSVRPGSMQLSVVFARAR